MSKHTPGPWQVTRGGPDLDAPQLFVDHRTGKYADPVANCYSATPETEANACLIAAAPDLLEALKAMVDRWEPDTGGADRRMWEDACAAIAKAEGA